MTSANAMHTAVSTQQEATEGEAAPHRLRRLERRVPADPGGLFRLGDVLGVVTPADLLRGSFDTESSVGTPRY